jgi:hypothetical protein
MFSRLRLYLVLKRGIRSVDENSGGTHTATTYGNRLGEGPNDERGDLESNTGHCMYACACT